MRIDKEVKYLRNAVSDKIYEAFHKLIDVNADLNEDNYHFELGPSGFYLYLQK